MNSRKEEKKFIYLVATKIIKNLENCTNRKEVEEELGIDLSKLDDTIKFVKNNCGDNTCAPDKEKPFRLCKIGNEYAPIDEPIADIILELNKEGFKTLHCCCGHLARIGGQSPYYIAFDFGEHIFNLISKIAKEITNVELKYTKDSIKKLIIAPKEEYRQLIHKIEIAKRDENIIPVNSEGYWKQCISFFYKSSKTEEAINLINQLISDRITN